MGICAVWTLTTWVGGTAVKLPSLAFRILAILLAMPLTATAQWSQVIPSSSTIVRSIILADSGYVIAAEFSAGDDSHVYLSKDDGTTWSDISPTSGPKLWTSLAAGFGTAVFVSEAGGCCPLYGRPLQMTRDWGETWSEVAQPPSAP